MRTFVFGLSMAALLIAARPSESAAQSFTVWPGDSASHRYDPPVTGQHGRVSLAAERVYLRAARDAQHRAARIQARKLYGFSAQRPEIRPVYSLLEWPWYSGWGW